MDKPVPEKNDQAPQNDPETAYIGNIWGWRNSFIGLAIILFFMAVAGIRYCSLDPEDRKMPPPAEQAF